jgi:hypothetical protein
VKELLDVVTRVYDYQRPHPALVGTASGLEVLIERFVVALISVAHMADAILSAYID